MTNHFVMKTLPNRTNCELLKLRTAETASCPPIPRNALTVLQSKLVSIFSVQYSFLFSMCHSVSRSGLGRLRYLPDKAQSGALQSGYFSAVMATGSLHSRLP